MGLHQPIEHENNKREGVSDNIIIKEEDISEYDTGQYADVKVKRHSIQLELNRDSTKKYSNVSLFGQKPYKCSKCTIPFNLKDFLIHKRLCSGKSYQHSVEKYQCNLCSACFTTKIHLEDHQRTHTGEKSYQCNYCDNCFANHSSLEQHMRIHTVDKPYGCNLCNSNFSQQNQLVQHVKIHQEEVSYNYQCSHCDKSFKSQVCLDEYMFLHCGIHTVHKPYTCSNCKKRYRYIDNMEKHQRLKFPGKKPNHCDLCDKSFTHRQYLNRHPRTYTGQKQYQCNHCEKCFTLKANLELHKKHHFSNKNTYGIQQSIPIVEQTIDASKEGSKQHMVIQLEVIPTQIELRQETRPFSNLTFSSNPFTNNDINTDGVNPDSNNKSCMTLEQEELQIKLEPRNMVDTIQSFSKVVFPLIINHNRDVTKEGSDQLMDVKIEEVPLKV